MALDVKVNEINDPRKMGRDISEIGHWGTGETQFRLKDEDDIEYIIDLITQSFNLRA